GFVGDDVDERAAGGGVDVVEHVSGDLDQVRVQAPFVPLTEDRRDLGGLVSGDVAQQVVGLGDELHVGIFDAVVHHLDEMSGAVGADVGAAGRAVGGFGRDVFEDRTERCVG